MIRKGWRDRAAYILMIPLVTLALAWQVLTGGPKEDDDGDLR